MRSHRDYDGGHPPLPSDVMPEERKEDGGDPSLPPDGESYRELLRQAHWHAKQAQAHIRKAFDSVDDVKRERARRVKAAKVDIEQRSRRFAIASNH
jgi:hypothetical protein